MPKNITRNICRSAASSPAISEWHFSDGRQWAKPSALAFFSLSGRTLPLEHGGEGGILTQPLSLSYHLFSNMHEIRMDIDDFYDLACINSLSYFICLGPIPAPNRHQRHQALPRRAAGAQSAPIREKKDNETIAATYFVAGFWIGGTQLNPPGRTPPSGLGN